MDFERDKDDLWMRKQEMREAKQALSAALQGKAGPSGPGWAAPIVEERLINAIARAISDTNDVINRQSRLMTRAERVGEFVTSLKRYIGSDASIPLHLRQSNGRHLSDVGLWIDVGIPVQQPFFANLERWCAEAMLIEAANNPVSDFSELESLLRSMEQKVACYESINAQGAALVASLADVLEGL